MDDSTTKSAPRKRAMVLALAGDSTTTSLVTERTGSTGSRRVVNRRGVYPALLMDPKHLLELFGVAGLFAIIFAETGLLIGFFLPGDSLLVFAGLVAATPKASTVHVNLAVVLVGCSVAAIVGAQTGYWIGRRAGPAIFRRPDSRLFKREYVEKAHSYFEKYGAKT